MHASEKYRKKIQARREAMGFSQEKLAEKTDLSAIFMSAIERGAIAFYTKTHCRCDSNK